MIAVRLGGMITILSALVSVLSFRFRSRASLELKLVALRHQLIVLRRQRPRRLRLHSADRLLWVCLYRVWPRVLDALVLVKPATAVKWHRQGFRIHWRWRYHRSRTHLSLNKDCADPRSIQPPSAGKIVAFPEFGRLHHRYERRAAGAAVVVDRAVASARSVPCMGFSMSS